MFFFLLAAQAAAMPATPQPTAAKPQKVCEMREVTGSRSKKRVCRDVNGRLDLGPGVKDGGGNLGSGASAATTGGSNPDQR